MKEYTNLYKLNLYYNLMDKINRLRRIARFYYLRKDVQECIAKFSKEREVVARYFNIFGNRPDIIEYPGDVRGLALQGVTSLHCSEELWKNALELRTELTSEQLDSLREGWDLILDIDCKFIEYSKIAAKLVAEALYFHNIIPDGPRIIASYLREMIVNPLRDRMLELSSLREISERLDIRIEDLMQENKLNPLKVVNIDTVLISSRHLFRMPYSLHERTGLSSIIIKPEQISLFHPGWAKPDRVYVKDFFPEPEKDEARELLVQAIDWQARAKEREGRIKQIRMQRKRIQDIKSGRKERGKIKYEKIDVSSINEEMFPPCIKIILEGMKQDGRKRALFILINFFRSLGIGFEDIEKKISGWNKRNYKPLRENYVKAQLSWAKRQEEKQGTRMPPNCSLGHYYKEIGACEPIALCSKIKNPINFTIRALRFKSNRNNQKTKIRRKTSRKK
jgi:DNA primase large subunit